MHPGNDGRVFHGRSRSVASAQPDGSRSPEGVLTVDMPGVDAEDLDLIHEAGTLTITAKRDERGASGQEEHALEILGSGDHGGRVFDRCDAELVVHAGLEGRTTVRQGHDALARP